MSRWEEIQTKVNTDTRKTITRKSHCFTRIYVLNIPAHNDITS